MSNNEYRILETERLLLRYQTHTDIEFLVALWSDPKVVEYVGGVREEGFLKNEFTQTAMNPFAEKYDLWVVCDKHTGKPIGHCGYIDKEIDGETEYELNYMIDASAWGNGYATEIALALKDYAFDTLGLHRIVAIILPENTASLRVAQKIGMRVDKEIMRPDAEIKKLCVLEKPTEPEYM